MTAADLLVALDLPDVARVDRRVPKTLLTEHGAPTAADRRWINEGIEQVYWVAALKPTTAAVAEHRDEVREYLEIAVLHVVLRATAKLGRLEVQIARLRAAAAKEKQLPRQVELNLELKRLEAQHAAALKKL